ALAGWKFDAMPEHLAKPAHDGEPEPETARTIAARIADLVELLEDARALGGGNARSAVPHFDRECRTPWPAADDDAAALGIPQRVRDPDAQDALDQHGIGADHAIAADERELQVPLERLGCALVDQPLEQWPDREIARLRDDRARVEFRHVEQGGQQRFERA